MIKMIDGAGNRVGQEEYRELEHRERMRKGTQKVLKNKNLHVGLIWLLSNLESVAGMETEKTSDEEGDNLKWIWLICAAIGALSLIEWLRHYLLMKVIYMAWTYIENTFKKMSAKIMMYVKATQSDRWIDLQAENAELQNKVFQLDLYIEELEQTIQQTRQQRDMALEECQLALKHGESLMRRSLKYRICRHGKPIHFTKLCPHFAVAEALDFVADA